VGLFIVLVLPNNLTFHTPCFSFSRISTNSYVHLHDPFLDVAAPYLFIKYAKFVPLSRFAEEEPPEGAETKTKTSPKHRRRQSEATEDGDGGKTSHFFEPNGNTEVSLEFFSPECLAEVNLESDYVPQAAGDANSDASFMWYGSRDMPQLDLAVSDRTWLADQSVTIIAHAKQRDDSSAASTDFEGWSGKSGGVVAACRIGLYKLFDPDTGCPKLSTTRLSNPMYLHGRLIGHLETVVQCQGLVPSYTDAQDFARKRLNEIRSSKSFRGAGLDQRKKLRKDGSRYAGEFQNVRTSSMLQIGSDENSVGHLRSQMLMQHPSSTKNALLGVGIADPKPVLLAVQIIKGRNLIRGDTRKANPYVKLQIGMEKRRTGTMRNTVDPRWDEVFVFGVGGGLRHLAEQNGKQLHVLLRVKDQDFGSDDDMGSAVLSVDFERALDASSKMEETWLSIQEPVPDSDSDEESEAAARRHSTRSVGGEILVVYKLISISTEEDPDSSALGLLEHLHNSEKSLDSSDDESEERDSNSQLIPRAPRATAVVALSAQNNAVASAVGAPTVSAAVSAAAAAAPAAAEATVAVSAAATLSTAASAAAASTAAAVSTVGAASKSAESGASRTSAVGVYDPGARHWWYVASDEARSVMGGYTGLEMAGWLSGGYFNKDLVVFYQGVPRVEWAKLHEMYADNMSRAFLEAPKKGGVTAADGGLGAANNPKLTMQQEIIRDTTFNDDALQMAAASVEKGSVLFSAHADNSKFWIIMNSKKEPVRMTIAEMREGVKQGSLTENMHTVPVGQQEWKALSSFY
jgi:hypothetical protein